MAYPATVVPVMIASPGDVEAERRIVREVLQEWNDINCAKEKVVLMPVGWETHSSPDLAGRPQEIINKHLLRDCDLLVGVFWTRLGTPTGVSPSGTVEEIREHHTAGKPVMLYFSSTPVSPGKIDRDQYSKVEQFKAWSRYEGLIEEYDSEGEFREKFGKQLDLILQQNEYPRIIVDKKILNNDKSNQEKVSEKRLCELAERILLAAAEGNRGVILFLHFGSSYTLQEGSKKFHGKDGREKARLQESLIELTELNFVNKVENDTEIFELTDLGWKEADRLRAIADETSGDRG